jgi:hypothetical protein
VDWEIWSAEMASFYLWGRIKDMVYINNPTTRADMIVRVQNAIRQISSTEILKAMDNFRSRTQLCVEEDGHHFEHL